TRLGGRGDGVDGFVDLIGGDRHFDLDLRQEAHRVFRAAIDFGVALLTSIALDLGHGHPVHADSGKRVADLVELERLDDGHDDFHGYCPPFVPIPRKCECMGNLRYARARERVASPGNAWARIKLRASSTRWG